MHSGTPVQSILGRTSVQLSCFPWHDGFQRFPGRFVDFLFPSCHLCGLPREVVPCASIAAMCGLLCFTVCWALWPAQCTPIAFRGMCLTVTGQKSGHHSTICTLVNAGNMVPSPSCHLLMDEPLHPVFLGCALHAERPQLLRTAALSSPLITTGTCLRRKSTCSSHCIIRRFIES